jgi:hypothetical protein
MDAVEAFSRMGVHNPAAQPPVKQWAIAGVNKFFAERHVLQFVLLSVQALTRSTGLMRWIIF